MPALSMRVLAACIVFALPARLMSAPDSDASPPQSPRLAQLQQDLQTAKPMALQAFWDAVKQAPFVEPIPTEPHFAYLTFLWRAKESDGNIAVACSLNYNQPADGRMKRLGDTDLWYKTYRVRDDARILYAFVTLPAAAETTKLTSQAEAAMRRSARQDPLNPARYGPAEKLGLKLSLVELPGVKAPKWLAKKDGVPAGKLTRTPFKSQILKNERNITVYTPPGFAPDGPPCNLLVVFDREQYTSDATIPTPTVLDNLAAEGKIPPTVAVFVGNVNRSKELPCNDAFAAFLAKELAPHIRAEYHVTDKSEKTVVAGASYGGLAAAFVALRHPEVFGNVLSQSGSFWYSKPGDEEFEWLTRQYVTSPKLSVRFYLEVGLWETGDGRIHAPTQVGANRHLRDVLRAKGYDVNYSEFSGGHDYFYWRTTFADALLSLIGVGPRKTDSVPGKQATN